MKVSYAERLQREALEKKVATRQARVQFSERLREKFLSDLAFNDQKIKEERDDLARALEALNDFNGVAVEPIWGGNS